MSMQDDELSALIRAQASCHKASAQLTAKVRTQLLLASAARPEASQAPAPAHAMALRSWQGVAAGFVAGVLLTMVVASVVTRWPPAAWLASREEAREEELVADHVRSLRAGPLLQVASSDRHTVKPWFQGKLDYAPPVLDLAEEGFPLLGARLEQVDRQAVATLVYGKHGHMVDLFVWPAPARQAAASRLTQVRGFNVMHWGDASMQFWVVSDMDTVELAHFVQALQARRQAP